MHVAVIISIKNNSIKYLDTSNSRLKAIVKDKTAPKTRNGRDIA